MSAGSSRRLSADARAQGLERRPVTRPGRSLGSHLGTDSAGMPWDFTGRVPVEQSWQEIAWPLFAVAGISTGALTAFFVTGSPSALVWTGAVLVVIALVADYHRRPARGPAPAAKPIPTAAIHGAHDVAVVTPGWGWTCAVCGTESVTVASESEASGLACTHDWLNHSGRLTAWLWTDHAAGHRTTSTRTASTREASSGDAA